MGRGNQPVKRSGAAIDAATWKNLENMPSECSCRAAPAGWLHLCELLSFGEAVEAKMSGQRLGKGSRETWRMVTNEYRSLLDDVCVLKLVLAVMVT